MKKKNKSRKTEQSRREAQRILIEQRERDQHTRWPERVWKSIEQKTVQHEERADERQQRREQRLEIREEERKKGSQRERGREQTEWETTKTNRSR